MYRFCQIPDRIDVMYRIGENRFDYKKEQSEEK